MDKIFEQKREQIEIIEKYQREIETLLRERPQLEAFQRNLEEQLNRIGSVDTEEGRANRVALVFSLLRDSLFEFREGLKDYQEGLSDALTGKQRLHLRLLK